MQNQTQEMFDQITGTILTELENGVRPWKQTWSEYGGSAVPINITTGKMYQGGNIALLWAAYLNDDFTTHGWLTAKQAQRHGGSLHENEVASPIVKFGHFPVKDPKNKELILGMIPFLKGFEVYNVGQFADLPDAFYERPTLNPAERNAAIEGIVARMISEYGLKIRERKNPIYSDSTGEIFIPSIRAFKSEHAYYSNLFNLIAQWSLGDERLNPKLQKKYSTRAMAFQAISCELAAAFLCAQYGYNVEEYRHAATIDQWIDVLKSDSKAFMSAAALASKIVRFVHGEEKPRKTREQKIAVKAGGKTVLHGVAA